MAEPKVSILLTLVDKMTAPVEGARTALGKFGASMKSLGTEAMDLLNNKLIQGVGFAGLVTGLKGAFDASDRFRSAAQALEGTAKITGVSLGWLQGIAEDAGKKFGLSKVQASEFAIEMAKLATKAGDVGAAGPALEAFLNIGAARGLTAAQTLKAVQQAILGIDEGTDKLFNANPSVLYAMFAESIGTTAGKLTDQQKSQALLTAAMEDGSKVMGQYAAWLETVAGKAAMAANAAEEASAKLGDALGALRGALASAKVFAADTLTGIVQMVQLAGEWIGAAFLMVPLEIKLLWTSLLAGVAAGVEQLGKLIPFVGDKIEEAGRTMLAKHRASGQAIMAQMEQYKQFHAEAQADILGIDITGAQRRYEVATKGAKDRVAVAKGEAKEQKEVWTGSSNVFKDAEREREEAAKEAERVIRSTWGLSSDYILKETAKVVTAHRVHAAALDTIIDGMDGVYGSSTTAAPAVKEVGSEIYNAARGAISLAEEFGTIDATAASVLNNVVNLADSLKDGLKGIAAGNLIGAIGSLAGLLGTMFSDGPQEKARKELILKNTQRLQELKDKMGELLNISTPGGKIASFKGINADELIASGLDTSVEGAGRRVGIGQVGQFLASKGLSVTDMRNMAKEFGIDLGDDGKNFSVSGIRAFFTALNSSQFSGFGSGIADQVERNDWMSGIFGTDAAGGLKGFAEALSGPSGSSAFGGLFAGVNLDDGVDAEESALIRSRTMGLAARFATGGVSEAEMGGASNSQFMQYLSTVISYLDSIANTNATTASAVTSGGIGTVADTDMGASIDLSTAAVGG